MNHIGLETLDNQVTSAARLAISTVRKHCVPLQQSLNEEVQQNKVNHNIPTQVLRRANAVQSSSRRVPLSGERSSLRWTQRNRTTAKRLHGSTTSASSREQLIVQRPECFYGGCRRPDH
ncbi:hypothetical protein GN244_ATG05865 [Phytophthora infestans]|uniref:Uncharacterized protein n=1 Tax=Phytophthora infestans TaxID=4787 RepID=A0A833T3N5_PHYIN|nr:hypothetical protein GN244_ATG05865 [Phytophthora infestans]